MPRIIIDYSSNIQEEISTSLFKSIHEYYVNSNRFSIEDIKSRAIKHDNYLIGDGNPSNAFVSIHMKIMEGREVQFRKQLSDDVLKIAKDYFKGSITAMNLNLTCFVSEIEKSCYSKPIN
ncbi:MAG: 5-carboxymethyl-2-hydroxymuconate isomerase [Parvicellaceae bacterium]|jgi:5-carboxymethyl-2-hydroxymuconate isomerase